MSTTKKRAFKVGDEVARIGLAGTAWEISRIVRERIGGKGWVTTGERRWTKSGLEVAKGQYRQRIVHVTDAHRRQIWERTARDTLASRSTWEGVAGDKIEAVARLLGWDVP